MDYDNTSCEYYKILINFKKNKVIQVHEVLISTYQPGIIEKMYDYNIHGSRIHNKGRSGNKLHMKSMVYRCMHILTE